jgi:hypothetical protein
MQFFVGTEGVNGHGILGGGVCNMIRWRKNVV